MCTKNIIKYKIISVNLQTNERKSITLPIVSDSRKELTKILYNVILIAKFE